MAHRDLIMKLIIAGSRNVHVTDEDIRTELAFMVSEELDVLEIVSGGARGVDKCGERYAKNRCLVLTRMPANWSLGKRAGYLRNEEMAHYADALLAFWDGESRGTKHMIDIMTTLKKPVTVKTV